MPSRPTKVTLSGTTPIAYVKVSSCWPGGNVWSSAVCASPSRPVPESASGASGSLRPYRCCAASFVPFSATTSVIAQMRRRPGRSHDSCSFSTTGIGSPSRARLRILIGGT